MKLVVCAIYDTAVKAFMQPFFSPTKGSAVRSFIDAVNGEGSQFKRHAADYVLFQLAAYDDGTGTFDNLAAPERLLLAIEAIEGESGRPPLPLP